MAHDSFQKAYCSLSRIGRPTMALGCYFQVNMSFSMGASVNKMIPRSISLNLWFWSESHSGLKEFKLSFIQCGTLKDFYEEKDQLSDNLPALSKSGKRTTFFWHLPYVRQAPCQHVTCFILLDSHNDSTMILFPFYSLRNRGAERLLNTKDT